MFKFIVVGDQYKFVFPIQLWRKVNLFLIILNLEALLNQLLKQNLQKKIVVVDKFGILQAGQEQFCRIITSSYHGEAAGFNLYGVNETDSFKHLQESLQKQQERKLEEFLKFQLKINQVERNYEAQELQLIINFGFSKNWRNVQKVQIMAYLSHYFKFM